MEIPWKSMSRKVFLSPFTSSYRYWGSIVYTLPSPTGSTTQKTWSRSNFWPTKLAGRLDLGGYFFTSKQTYESSDGAVKSHLQYDPAYYWDGPLFAYVSSFKDDSTVWPKIDATPSWELDAAGTSAIARCIPTNPVAGLATALGEIKRDGVPILPGLDYFKYALAKEIKSGKGRIRSQKARTRPLKGRTRSRSAGSEYLNLEYAWKPTVSDILKLARSVKGSAKILKQYEAKSGQNIRRRYAFPDVKTETSSVYGDWRPVGDNRDGYIFLNYGTLTITTVTERKRWFSGCFTYYLDNGTRTIDKLNRSVQLADKLLGVRLTPSVVWNLAPWSWAADWVANMGDIARNVTAFSQDGLVMRWGYIMEHKTSKVTYTLTGVSAKGAGHCPASYQQTFITETKERRQATPFGFGLDTSLFSARQWAIIGALGISRNPRRAM